MSTPVAYTDLLCRANPIPDEEEHRWREWVDSRFVHVISPNIYGSLSHSFSSFCSFDREGKWADWFGPITRYSIILLGSVVMYFVSGSLKKKHALKVCIHRVLRFI